MKVSNQRGSSLMTLVVTVSMLSILGMSILALTLSHFQLQQVKKKEIFSIYAVESGLEKAYAGMMQMVQEESKAAHEDAKTKTLAELEKQRIQYEKYKQYQEDDESEYAELPAFYKEDGTINEDTVKTWSSERYRESYASLMNGEITTIATTQKDGWAEFLPESISNDLPTTDNKAESGKRVNVQIDVDNVSGNYKPFTTTPDPVAVMELPIKSTYQQKDLKEHNIKATLKIGIPPYEASLSQLGQVDPKTPDILLTKALTAENNIVVNGGSVDVKGNIYAKGTGLTTEDYSGVVVGNKDVAKIDAQLKVNGQVVTGSSLHTGYGQSKIEVTGNVYAKSVGTDPVIGGSNIKVTGNVSTKNDLSLNGEKSIVQIDGNYYGFSDGSETANPTANSSSSIILNSADVGEVEGSKLEITGQVFIAGVAFSNVPDDADKEVESGTSIALLGNERAYGTFLKKKTMEDYLINTGDAEKFEGNNICFEEKLPLLIAEKYGCGKDANGDPQTFNSKDRADYFYYAAKQDRKLRLTTPDAAIINFGGTDGVTFTTIDSVKYSLGATIFNNDVFPATPNVDDLEETKKTIRNDYNKQVNKFGDSSTGDLLVQDTIDNHFNFANTADFSSADVAGVDVSAVNKLTIVRTNNDIVHVRGSNAGTTGITTPSSNVFDFSNSSIVEGVIVSTGDVYFLGDVQFKGVVITKGSIYFDGNSKITNDATTTVNIKETIKNTPALRRGFGLTAPLNPFFNDEQDTNNLRQIVRMENWRVVE